MKIESGCLCMIVNTQDAGCIVTAVRYVGLGDLLSNGKYTEEHDLWEIEFKKSIKYNEKCAEREINLERLSGFDFSHEKEK